MNIDLQKPRVPRTNKEAKPAEQGVAAVAQRLQAMSLMPLHAVAEGLNQSIRSFLQTATGLSKARISKGNLDAVRPSTQAKMDQHLERSLAEKLKDDPEALAFARHQIATAPKTQSGAPANLAGWVHQFEFLPNLPLPNSKAVGLMIDELLEALLTSCRNNDLVRFKQALLEHLEHHGNAVRVGSAPICEAMPAEDLAKLRVLEDWQQTDRLTRGLVDHLYVDLISALDAEWSSHYFAGRQTMPLFPLVMVRPQEGLMETKKVTSRKNVFFRPSRRLLEFLYALVYYIRYKKWPAKAPSPKVLAGILYRPNENELPSESLISNYFDGSTKLTLDLVFDHWVQLFQHFFPERNEGERVSPPFPLIMLALQWQALLIQDKGKSFLLLDMERYETLWHYRRLQWEAEQAERDRLVPQTGHTKGEPIVWPSWMFTQSSPSS